MDASTITGRIDAILKERGISKQEFYAACGISSAAYSQWNTGRTVPRAKRLQTISDYLNVNVEYLITGLGKKEKAPTPEGEHKEELSPAFFRLKQGLAPYNLSESDADFLLDVYKAHIKKNKRE